MFLFCYVYSLPAEFAAEIKAGGTSASASGAVTPSNGSTSAAAPVQPSTPVVVTNDDSTLNGDNDLTQNSEFNLDDTSSKQSPSNADLLHSGPNYAYIVSIIITA